MLFILLSIGGCEKINDESVSQKVEQKKDFFDDNSKTIDLNKDFLLK